MNVRTRDVTSSRPLLPSGRFWDVIPIAVEASIDSPNVRPSDDDNLDPVPRVVECINGGTVEFWQPVKDGGAFEVQTIDVAVGWRRTFGPLRIGAGTTAVIRCWE